VRLRDAGGNEHATRVEDVGGGCSPLPGPPTCARVADNARPVNYEFRHPERYNRR
jgi:hypothetical protein